MIVPSARYLDVELRHVRPDCDYLPAELARWHGAVDHELSVDDLLGAQQVRLLPERRELHRPAVRPSERLEVGRELDRDGPAHKLAATTVVDADLGPGGRIVKADVEAAAKGDGAKVEAPAPAEAAAPAAEPQAEERKTPPPVVSGDAQTGKGETTTQDLTRLQQTVARRMAESKATAPELVLNVDVDMEEAVDLRKRLKAAAGDRPAPSFNDLIVKAAALALTEFPRANGSYRDAKFELYPRVNVGVAVAGQDALVVPTVFDADRKSLGEIAR